MTDLGATRKPLTSHLPPDPREAAHTSDVWVSLSIALVLALAAATIALWPTPQSAKSATQLREPLPSKVASFGLPSRTEPAVSSVPTRFTNPFDASEVFVFPPGTTEDAARQSVAEVLLQRARDREALISSVKYVHTQPPPPFRIPALMSVPHLSQGILGRNVMSGRSFHIAD
jgi:hypothetical protein